MTCRRFIERWLWLLLLVTAATPTWADDFAAHYQAGLALYSSEDYEGAIREFQAAYGAKARPRLLFNIGQAHRNLGNAREALHFYLLYQALESNPKPGLKAELEGYIEQMKGIVAQAERARQAEEVAPAPPPSPIVAAPAEATAAPPWVATAPPPRRPVYRRGWFWGVVGGAAALVLVTGLAVGLGVPSGTSYGGDVRHPTF